VFLGLKKFPLDDTVALFLCVVIVVGIRIYSKRKKLSLPAI
jgi:hypothetical protein